MDAFQGDFYFLADFKLADVPHVNSMILGTLASMGFEGAVVHLFPGSVDPVSATLDLFGVVEMTHPGSRLGGHLEELLGIAISSGLSGLVVPATKPSVVRRVRGRVGDGMTLLAPGVGAQGARPGDALRSGADFEIVGRAIYAAPDPLRAAEEVVGAERDALAGGG